MCRSSHGHDARLRPPPGVGSVVSTGGCSHAGSARGGRWRETDRELGITIKHDVRLEGLVAGLGVFNQYPSRGHSRNRKRALTVREGVVPPDDLDAGTGNRMDI